MKVEVAPGALRDEATLAATVSTSDLLARQREGARGRDLWLVARAVGDVGLFPFIPMGIEDPADVARLVEGAPTDGKGVPVLLKQYLKAGAKVLAFNVDPAFSNALDALVLVDLRESAAALQARLRNEVNAAAPEGVILPG